MMRLKKGQTSIEFTFALIVTMLMAYAIMRLFSWSGRDMVEHHQIHGQTLLNSTGTRDYTISGGQATNSRQLRQINRVVMPTTRFDGVWDGN